MRKLSDCKRLPIDKTDNICEKCGRKMQLVTVKSGKFLSGHRYFMCENCHKLYPIKED